MKQTKQNILYAMQGAALPWVLAFAWWCLSGKGLLPKDFFPSPDNVAAAFREIWGDGTLVFNLRISIVRVLNGFLTGSATGFAIGVLLGLSRTGEKLIAPVFNAIRQVPLPAWAPLILLISVGEPSRVIFIAIGACYPVALNTFEGIRSVNKGYLEVGKAFEFNRARQFFTIVLPSSIPSILTGLRISLSSSWLLVVAAEIFMTSGGGIGEMMWAGREISRMDLVVVCVVTIALVGFTMNFLMSILEKTFSGWRRTMKHAR